MTITRPPVAVLIAVAARRLALGASFACALALPACRSTEAPATSGPPVATAASADGISAAVSPPSGAPQTAEIDRPAPDFTLDDLDGHAVTLSKLRGKIVVLEWFNPECPFVRAAHTKGSLVEAASRNMARGVVWLAINSAGAGKQGHGVAKSAEGKKRYGLTHPILLDERGEVGHRYGATSTPHMVVVDANGVMVYRGAVDNSPDGEAESPMPPGSKLVRHVDLAVDDLLAGRAVGTRETKAYGCSVKYADPS